jgi:hypothetical protein
VGDKFSVLSPEELARFRPVPSPMPEPKGPPILPGSPIPVPTKPDDGGFPVTPPVGAGIETYPMPEGVSWEDLILNAAPTPTGHGATVNNTPGFLDLKGEQHILDGDSTGGGHRPGTGTPGKSEFPMGWSDQKIKDKILDVASDSASSRTPSYAERTVIRGTRDGVNITVIIEPSGRIVTGFPTNVPRNP